MTHIQLFFAPGACSLAPHILLHAANIPYEAVTVAFAEGEHLTEKFAKLNPKKRVPVLVLDGEVLTEVPAISTAISDLAPDLGLMGTALMERARVYEWMNWLSSNLHGQGFGLFWRPGRASDDTTQHAAIQEKAYSFIRDCFKFIEGRLRGHHAVGDRFTAADAYLLVFYRWGNGIGFDMGQEFPKYTFLANHLAQLECVKAATAAEGIDALKDCPLTN